MRAGLLLAVLLALAGLAIVAIVMGPRWRRARLQQIRQAPVPERWDVVLRQRMAYYPEMTPTIRERLLAQMQVFIHEKRFIGCNGLVVTEEMRVVIAGWACLLSLGTEVPYPALRSILIYPDAFLVDKEYEDEAGVVTTGRDALIGESWEQGKVVLSWADIEADLGEGGNPTNVIVHEFAHQLDALDGAMAGAPPMRDARTHQAWAEIFSVEYERLQAADEAGHRGVIDPYGATEPAEFFAVVTEAFFETPRELSIDHPELYGLLTRYFALDPREWLDQG